MARISKYQFDQNVTKEDFVIGSDGQTKKTRNFKLEDLTEFFAKQQAILGNKFHYVYNQGTSDYIVGAGELSFNNKSIAQTPFSGVNEIYINSNNSSGFDISDYLQVLSENYGVLELFNSENVTYFGFFRILNINVLQNNVIKLDVEVFSSNGYIEGGNVAVLSSSYSSKIRFLDDVEDVSIENTQDRDLLVWDNVNSNWVNSKVLKDVYLEEAQVSKDIKTPIIHSGIIATPKIINEDAYIQENYNAFLFAPVSINSTITVGNGSDLKIIDL